MVWARLDYADSSSADVGRNWTCLAPIRPLFGGVGQFWPGFGHDIVWLKLDQVFLRIGQSWLDSANIRPKRPILARIRGAEVLVQTRGQSCTCVRREFGPLTIPPKQATHDICIDPPPGRSRSHHYAHSSMGRCGKSNEKRMRGASIVVKRALIAPIWTKLRRIGMAQGDETRHGSPALWCCFFALCLGVA